MHIPNPRPAPAGVSPRPKRPLSLLRTVDGMREIYWHTPQSEAEQTPDFCELPATRGEKEVWVWKTGAGNTAVYELRDYDSR